MKPEGGVEVGTENFFSYSMGRLSDFDEAAKGCERPGESKIIGDKLGEDIGDESAGSNSGEDGGDDEGVNGSPNLKSIVVSMFVVMV